MNREAVMYFIKSDYQRMVIVVIIAFTLVSSGCSFGRKKISAENEMKLQEASIPYFPAAVPNYQAEGVLEKAFRRDDVPWPKGHHQELVMARHALESMGLFLKTGLAVDGTLPFYKDKCAFEFINWNINIMKRILDIRAETPGALTTEEKVIYNYIVTETTERLKLKQQRLAATKGNMESKSSTNSIEELKSIYTTLQPLLKYSKLAL